MTVVNFGEGRVTKFRRGLKWGCATILGPVALGLFSLNVSAQAPPGAPSETGVYQGWNVVSFLDNIVVEDVDEMPAGVVEDIVFGSNGRLISLVVRIGGFWESGERLVNVPWAAVEIRSPTSLVVPITEESIQAIPEDTDAVLSRDDAAILLLVRPNQITIDVWKASDALGIPINLVDRRALSLVEDLVVVSDRIAAVIDDDHRTFPYEPVPASIRLSFLFFRLTRDEAEQLPAFDYRLLRGPVGP